MSPEEDATFVVNIANGCPNESIDFERGKPLEILETEIRKDASDFLEKNRDTETGEVVSSGPQRELADGKEPGRLGEAIRKFASRGFEVAVKVLTEYLLKRADD